MPQKAISERLYKIIKEEFPSLEKLPLQFRKILVSRKIIIPLEIDYMLEKLSKNTNEDVDEAISKVIESAIKDVYCSYFVEDKICKTYGIFKELLNKIETTKEKEECIWFIARIQNNGKETGKKRGYLVSIPKEVEVPKDWKQVVIEIYEPRVIKKDGKYEINDKFITSYIGEIHESTRNRRYIYIPIIISPLLIRGNSYKFVIKKYQKR